MIFIKLEDLLQAIREGLHNAKVNHDDAGYFETMIMRKVAEYQQNLEIDNKVVEKIA